MAINNLKGRLPLRITPYFASLIYDTKYSHPLRRNVVPVVEELLQHTTEQSDPLHEQSYSPVKGIVHRYPDRNDFEKAFQYIRSHTEIRDVLISGGDPLTLSDEILDYILSNIRAIEHVEMIRIGTRVPVVLPQRITDNLISILRKYHPLFISLHFSHPLEITDCPSQRHQRQCAGDEGTVPQAS
jgi:lysine 2,3-aminomutase